jgi:hypothetical protein
LCKVGAQNITLNIFAKSLILCEVFDLDTLLLDRF